MSQDTPTAKIFKEPLLKVLASLSSNKANRPVDYSQTYEPVCKMLGITVDQYGKQEGTNTNMVERWIQWAFKELVDDSLAVRVARGEWALTEKGMGEAQKIVLESTIIPAPTDSVPVSTGVSLPVGPKNDVSDAYHPDPYIRSLAVAETKCFGAFSDQSSICERCPLQGACLNAMATDLSSLARVLAEEDRKKEEEKERQACEGSMVKGVFIKAPPSVVFPHTPVIDSPFGVVGSQIITVQQQAKCGQCGNVIPKGTEAQWVRSGGGKSGLFHMTCFDPNKAGTP